MQSVDGERKILIPGTVVEGTPANQFGEGFLETIFSATSGLVLSQIREITGIESSALQNWIKRGWVSNPVNKKYNIDQVARILIINSLRGSLKLERIHLLLACVNGKMDDKSDDIIPESRLYAYLCRVLHTLRHPLCLKEEAIADCINSVLQGCEQQAPDARERIGEALHIMVLAYFSAQLGLCAGQRLQIFEAARSSQPEKGPGIHIK